MIPGQGNVDSVMVWARSIPQSLLRKGGQGAKLRMPSVNSTDVHVFHLAGVQTKKARKPYECFKTPDFLVCFRNLLAVQSPAVILRPRSCITRAVESTSWCPIWGLHSSGITLIRLLALWKREAVRSKEWSQTLQAQWLDSVWFWQWIKVLARDGKIKIDQPEKFKTVWEQILNNI